MSYGTPADKIVAYTYLAETYCPECTVSALEANSEAQPVPTDNPTVEQWLDRMAQRLSIDRQDERSFDSGDFPKVVFASQVNCGMCDDIDERCDHCGEEFV